MLPSYSCLHSLTPEQSKTSVELCLLLMTATAFWTVFLKSRS